MRHIIHMDGPIASASHDYKTWYGYPYSGFKTGVKLL
jgi:hypothetical protein